MRQDAVGGSRRLPCVAWRGANRCEWEGTRPWLGFACAFLLLLTTAVLALFEDSTMTCYNVGDSRAAVGRLVSGDEVATMPVVTRRTATMVMCEVNNNTCKQ